MKWLATRTRWALRAGVSAVGVLALFLAGGPTAFAATACGGQSCLTVDANGRYVLRASATPAPDGDFVGLFHMYGGGLDGKSALRHWRPGQLYGMALGRKVPDRTWFCVDGWRKLDEGGFAPHGHACVQVHE
ncbi:hypothetical protein [Streptomyces abikoensis]|uniref:hypothetical protein n=1 Tax=Streptomyces abikoensis TaxID=97398 RepID=UPI0033CCA778